MRPLGASRSASFQIQTPQTITSPSFASVGGGSPASGGVQRVPPAAKSRFQNLDDFLNESDSEEGTEESENDTQQPGEIESEDESLDDSEGTSDDESAEEGDKLVQGRQRGA